MTAAGGARPRRSATQSLLSIVLALDALLIFFLMMTAFGLELAHPGVVFGAGLTLMLVFVVAARFVGKPWGVWVGHILQLVLIALGFVLPTMFFVGALFAALWTYCFFAGRRLDRRNAAFFTSADQTDPSSTTSQE